MAKSKRIYDYVGKDDFSRDLILSSIMLYPESAPERNRYTLKALLAAAASLEAEELKKLNESPGKTPEKIPVNIGAWLGNCIASLGGWKVAAYHLLEGQQPDFHEAVFSRMRSGAIAGWLLDLALSEQSSIQKAAISYCETYQEGNDFTDYFQDLPGKLNFQLNEENITNNIWGEFQGAAHLWAALIHFKPSKTVKTSSRPRTYLDFNAMKLDSEIKAPDGFMGFCLLADQYREMGLKFRPVRSTKSLLAQDKSWQIPVPAGLDKTLQ